MTTPRTRSCMRSPLLPSALASPVHAKMGRQKRLLPLCRPAPARALMAGHTVARLGDLGRPPTPLRPARPGHGPAPLPDHATRFARPAADPLRPLLPVPSLPPAVRLGGTGGSVGRQRASTAVAARLHSPSATTLAPRPACVPIRTLSPPPSATTPAPGGLSP